MNWQDVEGKCHWLNYPLSCIEMIRCGNGTNKST